MAELSKPCRTRHHRNPFTPRQLEIIRFAACDLNVRKIGRQLGISPRTVEAHIRAARLRVGATTLVGLVAYCYANGIFPAAIWPPAIQDSHDQKRDEAIDNPKKQDRSQIGASLNHVRVGYVQTGMAGQDHREQFCALNAMDCDPIIEATSVPGYRSQFAYATKLLALGDTLVVPTLSQVAPSITELLHLLREHFYLNGINLNILTGPCGGQYRFDGTDLSGPLLLAATEIAVVLRRDLVASRTMNGLRIAQLKGRRGGRPLAMSEDLIAEAVARHREGESVASIARNLHVARSTLYRMLKMDKP